MGVYVKGNPKEGEYKLIKTTDGFVLDGKDIAYACIEIDLVRCGECKWYEPRHIEENGIECAGQCIWHIGLKTYCDAHDRENPEDRPRMIIFREPTDFCSYGERRADGNKRRSV